MNSFIYSPYDMKKYELVGLNGLCEAGCISTLSARQAAVWNLFWLSTPAVDSVPDAGKRWDLVYKPVKGWAAAITADVLVDDYLYSKLGQHPSRFVAWWRGEDHTIYDAYDVCGEEAWVQTVIDRAEMAAARIAAEVNTSPLMEMILGKRTA